MTRLRTLNNRKMRDQRRRARRNKLIRNGAVRAWFYRVTQKLATSLGCPERPWFKLGVK